ncbi:MAG TPA: DUF1579 domain-containing protein [Methylomirabilota bacterium]|nr:DUF1579 domain-containing protein [Methylomirabilota bacterium]
MKTDPQKEHAWLRKLVGEWTYEGEATAEPGKPPERFKGTETMRAIGELWIQGESKGEMPGGGAATMIITLGYDPAKQRFVGTWVGSMMAHLWVYEGELDAAGKVLTLNSEGPSMAGDGSVQKYQDIITVESADHRILTSRAPGPDGKWNEFMTAHYRRVR